MLPENWMFDYETMRVIWWVLLGVLLVGVAVMNGFDMGVATLLPFIGKTEHEKRVMINTVGPVWEGSQVWLILGGGAIFAAWPQVYALAFSGFYIAMFLLLASLILRPVGFKYRQKLEHKKWKAAWDVAIFVGGFVPSAIFGVAVGNVLQGVPFHYDDNMRAYYDGSFWQLFNPFALFCGIISLTMFVMHGAVFLSIKADKSLTARTVKVAIYAAVALLVLYTLGAFWAAGMEGYRITSAIDTGAASNPLYKTVEKTAGAYLANYSAHKYFILAPVLVYLGLIGTIIILRAKKYLLAFATSGLAVAGIVITAGVSMFPFIIPSITAPNSSLTVWDASSSRDSLFIMFLAVLIFMPIIIGYTTWVYRVLKGRVTLAYIKENNEGVY